MNQQLPYVQEAMCLKKEVSINKVEETKHQAIPEKVCPFGFHLLAASKESSENESMDNSVSSKDIKKITSKFGTEDFKAEEEAPDTLVDVAKAAWANVPSEEGNKSLQNRKSSKSNHSVKPKDASDGSAKDAALTTNASLYE